jgi:hypothetical protein
VKKKELLLFDSQKRARIVSLESNLNGKNERKDPLE